MTAATDLLHAFNMLDSRFVARQRLVEIKRLGQEIDKLSMAAKIAWINGADEIEDDLNLRYATLQKQHSQLLIEQLNSAKS